MGASSVIANSEQLGIVWVLPIGGIILIDTPSLCNCCEVLDYPGKEGLWVRLVRLDEWRKCWPRG